MFLKQVKMVFGAYIEKFGQKLYNQMVHICQKQGPRLDNQPSSSQRRSTVSDVMT